MLGHVSLGVRDLERAARFYDAILSSLGYVRLWTGKSGLGYGPPGQGEKLNVFQHDPATPPGPGFHLAFIAPAVAAEDHFHSAAPSAKVKNAGAPGFRPHHGQASSADYVLEPF